MTTLTHHAVPCAGAQQQALSPGWKFDIHGNYRSYNPSLGLEGCAGFLPGTNFLLRWDISVAGGGARAGQRGAWGPGPSGGRGGARGGNGRRGTMHRPEGLPPSTPCALLPLRPPLCVASPRAGAGPNATVRAWVGHEYMCAHGHRFIAGTADKPVRQTSTGYIKGTAAKVVEGNMPLVMPCPSDGTPAQLSRLHVVTPSAGTPVQVCLFPQIQVRRSAYCHVTRLFRRARLATLALGHPPTLSRLPPRPGIPPSASSSCAHTRRGHRRSSGQRRGWSCTPAAPCCWSPTPSMSPASPGCTPTT